MRIMLIDSSISVSLSRSLTHILATKTIKRKVLRRQKSFLSPELKLVIILSLRKSNTFNIYLHAGRKEKSFAFDLHAGRRRHRSHDVTSSVPGELIEPGYLLNCYLLLNKSTDSIWVAKDSF